MLIGSTGIVLGQPLTHDNDSCICYTDNQDKRCLECLINKPKRDSMYIDAKNEIKRFEALYRTDSTIISKNNERLNTLKRDIKKANSKVDILKKISFFGVPVALGTGFLVGILFSK